MSEPLLSVENATKVYRKGRDTITALDDVSLVVPEEPARITTIAGGFAASRAIAAGRSGDPAVVSLQELHANGNPVRA